MSPQPTYYACDMVAWGERMPRRERIYNDGVWRVAHAFNSALPGWLVLLPCRHVESLADLTTEEATQLGPLLHQLSGALVAVTGCLKTYVMLLAEAEGFQHLHVHLVPRMADQPDDYRGPRIFAYLKQPESAWVPAYEMDRIAGAIADFLNGAGKPESR